MSGLLIVWLVVKSSFRIFMLTNCFQTSVTRILTIKICSTNPLLETEPKHHYKLTEVWSASALDSPGSHKKFCKSQKDINRKRAHRDQHLLYTRSSKVGHPVPDSAGLNPAHTGVRALLGQPDVAQVVTAQLFLWACRTVWRSNGKKEWFAGKEKATKTWLSGCTMPRGNLLPQWNQVSSQGLWKNVGFCYTQTWLVTGQRKVTELQIETPVPLINSKCKKNSFSSSLTLELSEFLWRLHPSLMFPCNFIKTQKRRSSYLNLRSLQKSSRDMHTALKSASSIS